MCILSLWESHSEELLKQQFFLSSISINQIIIKMRLNLFSFTVLLLVICCVDVSSQSKKIESGNNNIVAAVGNIKITIEEFVNGYEYGPAFYKRVKDSKKIFLDNLIREKFLALDGLTRKLDTTQTVKEYYQTFRDDLATEELFKDEILSKVTFTQSEVDTIAKQKLIDVELQWLFTHENDGITKLEDSLKKGRDFRILFERQFNDTVSIEDRSLKSSRYQLEMKNRELGKIIDKLKTGTTSSPVQTNDGWYIVHLKNISYNMVPSETEWNTVLDEAKRAVTKIKMDRLSDKYVNELMVEQKPVIKRKSFQILRSYLAGFELPKEKYLEWELDRKLEEALIEYKATDQNDYSKINLVELKDFKISLSEYLIWYRTRDKYLKLDKKSFAEYSRSLEQLVWRLVRDKLLCTIAEAKGYYGKKNVVVQSKLWLEKILYATVKDEMIKSIVIENKEIKTKYDEDKSKSELIEEELTKKLFRKISELKKKYPVTINRKLLNNIHVSEEENLKAIEFYTVKRGGLIPRTPYPTVDNYWARWQ